VLLVFGGVWIGHVVEHFRVEGPAGLAHELTHSTHLYMLPLGALLALLAAVTGVAWMNMATALKRRLERATEGLARALRGGDAPSRPAVRAARGVPSIGGRWLALAALLGLAQLALYGIQENIEDALAGEGVSVVRVFAGAHWAAALVQVGVASTIAGLVVAGRRRVADLARRIDVVERLAHWLTRVRPAVLPVPSMGRARSFTPLERFGRRHLQRPPPRFRFSP
jgi:hypothetical protein